MPDGPLQVGVILEPGAQGAATLPWEQLAGAVLVVSAADPAGLELAAEAQARGHAYALVLTAEPAGEVGLEPVLRGAAMYEWPDVAFDTRAGDAGWVWAAERVIDLSQAVAVLAQGAAAEKAAKLAGRTRRVVLDPSAGSWAGPLAEARKVRATPI
jgi:hypothetical protein